MLYENDKAYEIRHIFCDRTVKVVFKTAPTRYYKSETHCKCGTSKKSLEYLGNMIKLLTR